MRYESEILYDLMKRDGLLNPSQDNLPYESELKEKYVNDVVGAYPKLQDYRPEWLNYNKCEHIPADFPTESQTNQISGTFENVIPFAYDVATLKGNTIVNISRFTNMSVNAPDVSVDDNGWITLPNPSFGYSNAFYGVTGLEKPNTQYTLILQVKKNTRTTVSSFIQKNNYYPSVFKVEQNIEIDGGFVGTKKFLLTTKEDLSDCKVSSRTYIDSSGGTLIFRQVLIEGDYTNVDIPYFEGMQSVQMPVLTTTGKNLFDKSKVKYNTTINADNGQEEVNNLYMSSDFISVKPNENYISNNMGVIIFYNENREYIGAKNNGTVPRKFTTPVNCKYIRVRCWAQYSGVEKQKEVIESEQLEQGTQATPYEPYQSNIVTVNDEVELRGFGNVQDTLDLKTGELTQCITEYTITGNEKWTSNTETDCQRFSFTRTDMLDSVSTNNYWLYVQSEKLTGVMWQNSWKTTNTISMMNGKIYMQFPLETTMEQAKSLMAGTKIQYAINPTIKTVDLRCINENNAECDFIPIMDTLHYQTSSHTIPPLVDLTVCVEATTQNLASFVDLDGVEHDE